MGCPVCKGTETIKGATLVDNQPTTLNPTTKETDELYVVMSPIHYPTKKFVMKGCAKCGCVYVVSTAVNAKDVI